MNKGHLSDYFQSIVAKRLSAVEADALTSNQHEFNGVAGFRKMFGDDKRIFETKFLYFSSLDDVIISEGQLTWYDARARHETRTEYRLYYKSVDVFENINEGDFLIICKIDETNLCAIIAEGGSTKENQLRWLFNLSEISENNDANFRTIESSSETQLNHIGTTILEGLGFDASESIIQENYLDVILATFKDGFPTTKVFSEFARANCEDVDPLDSPDLVILSWMEFEEMLFRTFEKYLAEARIARGFKDIDTFVSFALSILNRRKSRAGLAFENHLYTIFEAHEIPFSHNVVTELKSRPDFIFPGIEEYRNKDFPDNLLRMLAVKTSCKDRWRQVLAEAKRIPAKHLITLEPGISVDQTDEMKEKRLQLVVPESIHQTYRIEQQSDLMNLSSFMELVKV